MTSVLPHRPRAHRRAGLDLATLRALFVEGEAAPAAGGGAAPASGGGVPAAQPAAAPDKAPGGGSAAASTSTGGEPLISPITAADINVTPPEGFTVDEKAMADFKAVMSDPALSPQDRAQRLFDMHANALRSASDASFDRYIDMNTKWQAEVLADKELGGQNYDAMRSTIAKAVTDFGGKDAQAIFDAFKFTGAGNNPAIVRLLYRMSQVFVEGDAVSGGAVGAMKDTSRAAAIQAMYPSARGAAASKE